MILTTNHEVACIFGEHINIDGFDLFLSIMWKSSSPNGKKVILEGVKFHERFKDAQDYLKKIHALGMEQDNPKNQEVIKKLIKSIQNYFSGIKINLLEETKELGIELNLEKKFRTIFSRKVVDVLIDVNYGEFTTYAQIGEKMGSRAYQAIGNVLRNNPLPLIVPCHRVLKKNGAIGGFMGMTNGGWEQDLKKKLIALESL